MRRWADWIAVILSGSTLILTLLFLPETFSPILLSWRATHLRHLTKCNRFKAEIEIQGILSHLTSMYWHHTDTHTGITYRPHGAQSLDLERNVHRLLVLRGTINIGCWSALAAVMEQKGDWERTLELWTG